MIGEAEKFLTAWLGTPPTGVSWFQILAWLAALAAATFAGISLRRQSLQSRAKLILDLHVRWEALEDQRRVLSALYRDVERAVVMRHARMNAGHQVARMRTAFAQRLAAMRDGGTADRERFRKITEVLSFFELLGMCVRNGYLPVRDARQMYKGPILQIEVAFTDFAREWQQGAHMASGLLSNTLYLTHRMNLMENRRLYYWCVYRPCSRVPLLRRCV